MLTCHRNIVVPPECGFAVWWAHKYIGYKKQDWSSKALLSDCLEDILSSRKIEYWGLGRPGLFEFICDQRIESYSDVVDKVYRFYAANIGKIASRWGDKNNFYILHILEIHRIFPSAQFIHIVRDVRDVVCSYKSISDLNLDQKYSPKLPVEVNEIVAQWGSNIMNIRTAFDVLQWKSVLEIAFEELVLDSERVLKKVCNFLGEDFDIDMLNYPEINKKLALEPVDFMKWKAKVSEAPRRQEVGRFRAELTSSEIREIEDKTENLLFLYGYKK